MCGLGLIKLECYRDVQNPEEWIGAITTHTSMKTAWGWWKVSWIIFEKENGRSMKNEKLPSWWNWGLAAKAHPKRRHIWLLRCSKLRPWFFWMFDLDSVETDTVLASAGCWPWCPRKTGRRFLNARRIVQSFKFWNEGWTCCADFTTFKDKTWETMMCGLWIVHLRFCEGKTTALSLVAGVRVRERAWLTNVLFHFGGNRLSYNDYI